MSLTGYETPSLDLRLDAILYAAMNTAQLHKIGSFVSSEEFNWYMEVYTDITNNGVGIGNYYVDATPWNNVEKQRDWYAEGDLNSVD